MENFVTIQQEVRRLGQKIGAPSRFLVLHSTAVGDGTPYIEIDASEYQYVIEERGMTIERRKTADLDVLLYWIFDGMTSSMSWDYELKNRVEGQDFRRIAFERKIHLMMLLKPKWAEATRNHIASVLKENPYEGLLE